MTKRAGSRRLCWRKRTLSALAVCPIGMGNILFDFCPVLMNDLEVRSCALFTIVNLPQSDIVGPESSYFPTLEVAPASAIALGMVPWRTASLN